MKCLHSSPSFEYHVSIAYMHDVPPITNQKRAQRKRHHPIRKQFSLIASKVWALCLSYFDFPSTLYTSTEQDRYRDQSEQASERASKNMCDIPFDSSVCIRRLLNIQAYCHEYTHLCSFIHRCMHTIRCANLYFGRKVGEYQRASYVEVSWLRSLLLYSSSSNRFNKSESTHMFHFASFVRSFVPMYVVWVMVFSMMLEIRKH